LSLEGELVPPEMDVELARDVIFAADASIAIYRSSQALGIKILVKSDPKIYVFLAISYDFLFVAFSLVEPCEELQKIPKT